jgi:hypothetical protein
MAMPKKNGNGAARTYANEVASILQQGKAYKAAIVTPVKEGGKWTWREVREGTCIELFEAAGEIRDKAMKALSLWAVENLSDTSCAMVRDLNGQVFTLIQLAIDRGFEIGKKAAAPRKGKGNANAWGTVADANFEPKVEKPKRPYTKRAASWKRKGKGRKAPASAAAA